MTTSVVPAGTYMGLSPSQFQEFSSHVMEREVFGAFMLAFDARRSESGMTQSQLAERLGKDKTGTSRLLSAPRNWTIRTISDLSMALNVVVEISLRDRVEPARVFTAAGVTYVSAPATSVSPFSGVGQQIGTLSAGTAVGFNNESLSAQTRMVSAAPVYAFQGPNDGAPSVSGRRVP
jgi:transcriptional regulator with XRE-family HTH domain